MRNRVMNMATLVLAVLPAVGWGLFAVWTRNPFRLDSFSQAHEFLCLGLTALPVLWWLVWTVLRRGRGIDLAMVLISLAACGWILLLCSGWGAWDRALVSESIGPVVRDRLRVTALACTGLCILPLLKALLDLAGRGEEP